MKKLIIFILLFLFIITDVKAVTLNTKSIYVKDLNSNRVFYAYNETNKRLIASTTKIMTAILAIESNKLEHIVLVGDEILKMYGSNIYLEVNEQILLLDLIYGLILRSGNDAAVAIAKYIGGSEQYFIQQMNNKARELGMDSTIFNNPSGLDDETKNYSTANDLITLYTYAYKNETFRKIINTTNYNTSSSSKTYTWSNKCDMFTLYDKTNGCKTGYTPDAGRVLVSSASNNDLNLAIASFNSIYDYSLHTEIYEEIFYKYQNILILDKDNFSLSNNPFKEEIYIKNSFIYPLSREERDTITKRVKYFDKKNYKDGDVVGEIYIFMQDDVINKADIHIKVKEDNIFNKLLRAISNLFA